MAVITVPDASYSWWVDPLALNLGDVTWVGSIGSDGVNRVDRIDWRTGSRGPVTLDGPHTADEHNTAALAAQVAQPELIAFYARHGGDAHIRYQFVNRATLAAGPQQQLTFSAGLTYAQVLHVPGTDTLHVLTRGTGSNWWYRSSSDWGVTWGAQKTLLDTSELTGTPYLLARPDHADPSTVHMAAYIRANSGTFHNIGYCRIDLSTGAITDVGGAALGDLDDATGPSLDLDNQLSQAVVTADNTRLLDIGSIGGQPAIGYALWVGALGPPTYRVAVWNGATWDDVAVVATGEVLGHDPEARYVGGMALGRDGADGLLRTSRQTVPDPGDWVLESWQWNGAGFDLTGELARSATRLVRPVTVQGAGSGVWMHERFTTYNGFTDYAGDIHLTGTLVPPAPAPAALQRSLTGSHRVVVDARVVTGHPVGGDPAGTTIPVVDGEVVLDGTAEIRGTLRLDTTGVDGTTGKSAFPRRVPDLLAPYGAEIFLRYGVDLAGAGPLWTPLGYYRIEEPDQGDSPYGVVSVAGRDRMAAIVEALLLTPRTYPPAATLGEVVADLVTDIYPTAAIVWDDASDLEPLGRVLLVEESRYEAIRDIADSRGKIVYWDREGALRIEAAPDESVPVWEVRAGAGGVLVNASRRVSRRETANAIILVGQAADDQAAVRAVAIDANPTSPTYWFGPFGQVPRKVESPLVSTQGQAEAAVVAILRRSLGAAYQVEISAVPNPTLQPWDPVRVTHRDGSRDVMVMQRVSIPLRVGRPMAGTTRSKILAAVGSLT